MSWWQALHIAVSVAVFVTVWIEGNDEPFWLRTLTAALVALLWLPLLILCVAFVSIDWVSPRVKKRKP